jgi:hypothetical protein
MMMGCRGGVANFVVAAAKPSAPWAITERANPHLMRVLILIPLSTSKPRSFQTPGPRAEGADAGATVNRYRP